MHINELREMIQNRQDRLIAFFDAILAIAITVLALEITVPALGSIGAEERSEFLVSFTCYLISFLAMAMLWYIHTNFFSHYQLTGSYLEIILHLVLLFVVTLFQPMTKAIGLYREDSVVRRLYLATFIVMNVLNLLIIWLVRRNTARKDAKKEHTKSVFEAFLKSSTEEDERSRLFLIAYGVNHPAEIMDMMKDKIPDEYYELRKKLVEARKESYRMSMLITIEVLLFISAAVVALMYSLAACYVFLVVGVALVFVTRFVLKNIKNS